MSAVATSLSFVEIQALVLVFQRMEKLSGYGDSEVVQPDEGVWVHSTGFRREGRLCSHTRHTDSREEFAWDEMDLT